MTTEGRQTDKSKWYYQPLVDGINYLRDAFEIVSELTMQWFPEEFPVHWQNILHSQQSAISEQSSERYKRHLDEMSKEMWKKLMETIPLLADRHQDTVQKNLKKISEDDIKEKEDKIKETLLQFWNVIEISISMGKLSEMINQCNNIKELIELIRQKFGKIFPGEISKHEEKVLQVAIVKVFEVIKTGQTKAKLIAEGKRGDVNRDVHQALEHAMTNLFSVIEGVLEIMKKLPPEEILGYCQIINRSQRAVEVEKSQDIDFVDSHSRYLYQVSQDVLFKSWSIIQGNLSEESYLSVIPNQCAHITKLIKIIRGNFGKVSLEEHQKELRKSIEKLWHLIQTKQTKGNLIADGRQGNKNKKDDDALDAGITYLFEVIQRVLKLIMEFFPEEFPDHNHTNQNIQQSKQTVEGEQSRDSDAVYRQKPYFYQISKNVLLKIWEIIEDNLSKANDLSVVCHQCDHTEKLMELIRKNLPKELQEHEKRIHTAIAKVWDIIQTTQTKTKLIEERNIKALGDVIERVSELTMKMLPTEEFPAYCQNIQRSRQAVQDIESKYYYVKEYKEKVLSKLDTLKDKYQEKIDQAQLNKQKRKCESEADCETPQKRQYESSGDGRTSEKRPHESSDDDSERQEKRQRLAESSNHGE